MRKNLFFALTMTLLATASCTKTDIEETISSNGTLLRFTPAVAQLTRAAESTTTTLCGQANSEASAIPVDAYKGALTPLFKEKLTYNGTSWTTTHDRFSTDEPISAFAYYATDAEGRTALSTITYSAANGTTYPQIKDFTIGATAATQIDLIAAKAQNTSANEIDIKLTFKHLLSQVNFGIYVANGQQVLISNIQLNNLLYVADFNFDTWSWQSHSSLKTNYPYVFPDGHNGEGYTADNSNGAIDGFIFGDGGEFGAEDTNTTPQPNFVYAQPDKSWKPANTAAKLKNSLMLLPQAFGATSDAAVSFDYTVKSSINGEVIKNGTATIPLKKLTAELKPNCRYIFMFRLFNSDITTETYTAER